MKIYSSQGVEILDIQVDDSSVRYRSIMSDDSLTLKFSHIKPVVVPVGSYVDFEGQRYTLWLPENFKKHNTRNFEYTITLGGWREALKLFKFKDLSAVPYRLKFLLTARPIGFMQLIVDNMNTHSSGWTVGSCIDAVERTLSFNHEYCLDVAIRVAQEWDTEIEFEGKKVHLRKVEKFKDAPLPLSYGKGNGFKSGVGRFNDGDKQPIGRLYVQGGERNIDYSTYGSPSLLLPKNQSLVVDGKTYRSDAHGMYITRDGNELVAEDSFDASHIYPKRVGTVSEVIEVDAEKHFYDIRDTSIPESLDYSECRIDGEKATISFQSGVLAGREFDIEQTDKELTGYIHEERLFKIVPQELDGIVMPGGMFVPAVGDAYAIFNISMPGSYIADNATQTGASWDMMRECVGYFTLHEKQKFSFVGTLDGLWSKSKWLEIGGQIVPGGHINFSDTQFLPDGEIIRITAVKDYVNFPYKPEITLSNAPIPGGLGSQLGGLEGGEVVIEDNYKKGQLYAKRQWRDLIETMGMLEDGLLNFDKSINPITVRTMQLIVGDESLQFRFVSNKANPQALSHTIAFDAESKVLTASSGIIQHMTLGIKQISTHKASDYLYWDMAAYQSPPLEPSKSYYLYAKCSKTAGTGAFLLSKTAIEMQSVAGYYHFLVAIVNSEFADNRSIVTMYGFTEILPGRITTDKIVSSDGKTYFDLVNSKIVGKIKFLNENNEEQEIETVRLFLQYSVDGVNWHDAFQPTDRFMRQKNGVNGTWTGAMSMGRDGEDGVGFQSSIATYQYHTSGTSAPTGTWLNYVPPVQKGKYLWTRITTKYTDNSTVNTYSVAYQATDGQKGDDGKGIASSSITYQSHTNGTSAPTGIWRAYIPTVPKGGFLWTRTITTYTDGSTSTTYSTSYYATDGEKGVGVKSVTERFYPSTSRSTPTGGSWRDTQPPWEKDKYVFSRFRITYTDNSVSHTDPILNYDAEALAKANEAKAITDNFGTDINGGLVQTVMMQLREAAEEGAVQEPPVTAGTSGIQKDIYNVIPDNEMPAFWAGGTYQEAIDGVARAIIRHDGKAIFLEAEIGTRKEGSRISLDENSSNALKLFDENQEKVSLEIGNPTSLEGIEGAGETKSVYIPSAINTSPAPTTVEIGAKIVTYQYDSIIIKTPEIKAVVDANSIYSYIELVLYSTDTQHIVGRRVAQNNNSATLTIPATYIEVKGRREWSFKYTIASSSLSSSPRISVSSSSQEYSLVRNINRSEITTNGANIMLGSDRFLHIGEDGMKLRWKDSYIKISDEGIETVNKPSPTIIEELKF